MARIILIDDDPMLRRALRRTLEQGGHTVEDAADGHGGVAIFDERGADLVITDLIMPNAEGIETIQALLRRAPALKILAISGGFQGTRFDMLPTAKILGATDTMRKPIERAALLDRVAALLAEPQPVPA